MFQSIIQDARYAVRLLLKRPEYTAVALLTLALGIGGSTAIFTVVDAVVIEALPYPDPDRLVVVWERAPAGGRNSVSPAMFGDWAAEGRLFQRIAARQGRAFVLSGEGTPEQVPGALVTPGYFEVLGVLPASGRGFTADDAVAGNAVIVTHRFARRHLAGEGTRTLRLDGESHVVVGILPEGSFDRGEPDVYRAATVPVEERRFRYLTVIGRLRDGVSMAQAESRLQAIAAAAAIQHPETNRDWGVVVEPLRDRVIGASLRQTVLLLFMGAMVVLLVACANVASLTLARAAGRSREVAVRTALGAGRARLVRQLLTESLVLGATGGLLGVVVAVWAVRALVAILPPGLLPPEVGLKVDAQVLAFAAGASLCAGLFCGLAPAERAGAAWLMRYGARAAAPRPARSSAASATCWSPANWRLPSCSSSVPACSPRRCCGWSGSTPASTPTACSLGGSPCLRQQARVLRNGARGPASTCGPRWNACRSCPGPKRPPSSRTFPSATAGAPASGTGRR
jgi:putative ABC transport system permease protein